MHTTWQLPPARLYLDTDEVQVWVVSLDRTEAERTKFLRSLSHDEKMRADRFYFDHDRYHYIAARGLLRLLLGGYLHKDPSLVTFAYGEHGKPMLVQVKGDPQLEFNVSHSHGMALLAFGYDRAIGVDIEEIRPLSDAAQIAKRFFSAREYGWFTAVPAAQQPQAFFNCWTRKEAYIKAIGDGLSCPLDAFDVTLTPGQPARLLTIRGSSLEAEQWQLHTLEPKRGYVGAVIAAGKDWRLTLWKWPDSSYEY